ncbi:MAG TPA: hypothetical protein VGQ53_10955 [Chitinophagaceae bacterium]|jgi:hypothetical protein|nr:hypothetical protein [Chitinophagaceae bacterium]
MKKIFVLIIALATVSRLFSQQTQPDSVKYGTKDYYLQKSKRQKSGARALVIGGTALMVAGLLIGDSKNADFDQAGTGAIMFGIGFLADMGSIPLFIASSKNKKRAMKASVGLKIQDALAVQKQNFMSARFPAISFHVRL